jgi:hypothetical protein
VLLQALSRPAGPAGRCIDAMLSGSVELYISRFFASGVGGCGIASERRRKVEIDRYYNEDFLRSFMQ